MPATRQICHLGISRFLCVYRDKDIAISEYKICVYRERYIHVSLSRQIHMEIFVHRFLYIYICTYRDTLHIDIYRYIHRERKKREIYFSTYTSSGPAPGQAGNQDRNIQTDRDRNIQRYIDIEKYISISLIDISSFFKIN